MSVWKLIEKLKPAGWKPKTARQLAGWPVEYEFKKVSTEEAAVMDDRIMADGRPAHAWWAEIEMLRAREPELQKKEKDLMMKFAVLKIAEWGFKQDALDYGKQYLLIKIDTNKYAFEHDPLRALVERTGEYCEVVK